jgi:RimJ/RimL family protein N-acetyltransferase
VSPEPERPPLSDGVLTLRPPDERDLDAIDAGTHDPEVVHWLGHQAISAREVLSLNRERWAHGSPTFAICGADGTCVGHVWINVSTADPTSGYIGYWLLPGARGRGLATRAVRLLAAWAVEALQMTTVRLLVEPANERSQRVAERAGFRRVGILLDHDVVDGRAVDRLLFELPRREVPS